MFSRYHRAIIDRRSFLGGAASTLGASALAACGGGDLPPWPVVEIDRKQPIVDAHAHVFNAKDLPGFEFVHEAYIQRYAGLFLEPLMPVFRDYAERIERAAPGFEAERREMAPAPRSVAAMPAAAPPPSAETLLTETLRALNAGNVRGAGSLEQQRQLYQQLLQLDPSPPAPRAAAIPAAAPGAPQPEERRLAAFLLQRDFPPPAPAVRSTAPPAAGIPRAAAAPAPAPAGAFAASGSEINQLLKWFSAFKEYRRQRIMAWSDFIGTTGPKFVMPAIIDFGYSLRGVNYTEVPVPQQVQLMGELARRQDAGLLVHGYVPFNPIRFVKDQADATGAIFDAIDNQGFIGIKLYPPMGFQASGNDKISMHFFDIGEDRNTLGKRIDGALNWIYDYCLKHDVTIMVHTAPSNTPHGNPYDGLGGGRDDWSRRPDPKYWDAVLSAGRQNLRVLFGHFGGAYTVSKNRAWVDSIVGLMMKYPNVYGDFSDYDLVLDNTQDQRAERRELKNYLQTLDAARRQKLQQRLVFGSDWEMLDLVVDTKHYTRNMLGFLTDSLGGRVEDYAACNALRMIGLDDPNSKTSQRLLRFHQRTANRATLMTFMQLTGPERVAAARSATR